MCVCPDTHDIFCNLLCLSRSATGTPTLSHASPLVRYSFGWSKKTSLWLHRPTHTHTHTHYTVGSLLISRFLRFCMKLHRSRLLQLLPMTVSAVHDSFEVDTISFLSFLIYIFPPVLFAYAFEAQLVVRVCLISIWLPLEIDISPSNGLGKGRSLFARDWIGLEPAVH